VVVVSDAVGVSGAIRATDYLVSGVLVVSERFLQLLYNRGGALTPQDWQRAPQWTYFSSGGFY